MSDIIIPDALWFPSPSRGGGRGLAPVLSIHRHLGHLVMGIDLARRVTTGLIFTCSLTFPNEYSLVPIVATCFLSPLINGIPRKAPCSLETLIDGQEAARNTTGPNAVSQLRD